MAFGDYKSALAMRDLMERLAKNIIDRERPRYRYATVVSIDRPNLRCAISFAGETGSITVNMGSIQPNAVGQVVRVGGIGSDKFIEDVMGLAYADARITALDTATDGRLDALEGQTLDARLDTLEGQTLDARLDTLEGRVYKKAELTRSTAYNLLNGFTSMDAAGFWTETSDPDGIFTNGIATIPADGWYNFTAHLNVTGSLATGRRIVQVERLPVGVAVAAANTVTAGGVGGAGGWHRAQNSGGAYVNITATRDSHFLAGEKLRVLVYNNGGATTVNADTEGQAYMTLRQLP